MGGFISLYALFAQRAVFGLAGVMSPSVRWADYRIWVEGGRSFTRDERAEKGESIATIAI